MEAIWAHFANLPGLVGLWARRKQVALLATD
jgi:hypothetical protein